jgi:hypothetical protein
LKKQKDVLKFKNEKIIIFQCLKNCSINLSIFYNKYKEDIKRIYRGHRADIVKAIEKAI